MSQTEFQEDPWPPRAKEEHIHDALLLSLDAYEGPIDVLLSLARDQKVDLAQISILALAEQYLAFVDRAKEIRLELAADYLVMAAWLAYLKSKHLLPSHEDDAEEELSGPEMAEALAFQLRRLEAMQHAADLLFDRPLLGKQVFARGHHEDLKGEVKIKWEAKLFDLLNAYGEISRRGEAISSYEVRPFELVKMEEAMARLTKMLGKLPRKGQHSVWTLLTQIVDEYEEGSLKARSALASTFTAGLELAKQGRVDIRQDGYLKPIYIRERTNDT